MISIGEMIDRLTIENIKIFKIREELHNLDDNEAKYTELFNKMNMLNENRSIISNHLDEKIDNVVSGKEKNSLLKNVKTYGKDKSLNK